MKSDQNQTQSPEHYNVHINIAFQFGANRFQKIPELWLFYSKPCTYISDQSLGAPKSQKLKTGQQQCKKIKQELHYQVIHTM